MDGKSLLAQEWNVLQVNCEQYEKSALTIKLVTILSLTLGLATDVSASWLVTILLHCWVCEAMVKTYQSRLEVRLLSIETLLSQGEPMVSDAMKLHTQWASVRPKGLEMIKSYAVSGLRPTVLFPYAPLILCVLAGMIVKLS